MENNKNYNVNIYYNEEEVHHAFKNYFEEIRQHSKVHVFTNDPLPLSFYGEEENVELHSPGSLWDKLKAWMAGEEHFQREFSTLNISEADRENYRTIIQNGGTIIVSTQDEQIDNLFFEDHAELNDDAELSTSAQYITGENDPLLGENDAHTLAETERESFNTLPDEAEHADASMLSHLDAQKNVASHDDLDDNFEATPEGTFSKGFNAENIHAETITNEEQLASTSFNTNETMEAKQNNDETLEPINYTYGEVKDTHIASPSDDDTQRGKQTFLSNVDTTGNTEPTYRYNDIQSPTNPVNDENIMKSDMPQVEHESALLDNDIEIVSDGYQTQTNKESISRIPDEASTQYVEDKRHLKDNDENNPIFSDGYSKEQQNTESTFDVVNNRNSQHDPKNDQLNEDLKAKLDEQTAEHKKPFTFDLEEESTSLSLEEDSNVEGLDTAHRPDILEDEAFNEMSKEHPLNDVRNDAIGNATEHRRHDLP